MTPVEISSTFLKSFYHVDQQSDTHSLKEENRHLRDELLAARVLLERRNQEPDSMRGHADCCSMQFPTTLTMVGEDKTHTTRKGSRRQPSSVSISIPIGTSLPMEESEIITAKVERAIPRASVRKTLKRSTPLFYEILFNGNEPDSETQHTASTCSLSMNAQRDDEEHDMLDDLVVIGDSDTDRQIEEPSAQTFIPTLHTKSGVVACKDRSAENGRIPSDVTTKACNISTNARDGLVKEHETIYPVHHSPTMPSDAQSLTSPTRLAAALQPSRLQGAEILIHAIAMSLEVEKHSLRDAFQRKGTYTGSIDSRTLLPDGFGTMIYESEEYEGDWEQGYFHGYGKHTNAHGDVYEGPFHSGQKQGKENATMRFGDGRRFQGRFHADKMREGILYYADGSWYEGLLENDKRDGFGLYFFVNGDEYEGQWKDDLMHGRGRMDWKSDETWYTGEWEFGIMNGTGTKVDSNGNIIHQGYFYDGEPVIFAEPIYEDGEFSDDDSGAF